MSYGTTQNMENRLHHFSFSLFFLRLFDMRKVQHHHPFQISLFLIFSILSTGFIDQQSIFVKAFVTIKPTQNTIARRMTKSNNSDHVVKDASDGQNVTVGFIGMGTIASSISTGLLSSPVSSSKISSVIVTKRSETKSSQLKEKFGSIIEITEDLQYIVDKSDVVFLCVLPTQTETVLKGIDFKSFDKKILISLVSTAGLEDLKSFSGLAKENIYKMICLPAVAHQEGVSLVVPPISTDTSTSLPLVKKMELMLTALGGFVDCQNETEMKKMMISTGLMGPFYGILRQNRDYLVKSGISSEKASYFLTNIYSNMIKDALLSDKSFDELIEEQTPGGLNEQALRNMDQLGVYESYGKVMDALYSRMDGKSDGSVTN